MFFTAEFAERAEKFYVQTLRTELAKEERC